MKKSTLITTSIILVLISIIIFLIQSLSNAKDTIHTQKQNLLATSDTLIFYKNKAKEQTAEITMFKSTKKDLKTLNNELYKELKKQKGKIKYITKIKTKYVIDTITIQDGVVTNIDSLFSIKTNYNKNGFSFNTDINIITPSDSIIFKSLIVSNLQADLALTMGIKSVKGIDKVFVSSNNKNVIITDVMGTEVINNRFKKPSRFALGLNFGYGLYYDVMNDRAGTGITASIGLNYNLIRFGTGRK